MKKLSLYALTLTSMLLLVATLLLSSCTNTPVQSTSPDVTKTSSEPPGTNSVSPETTSSPATSDVAGTSITIFVAKPEIAGMFEEMLATYSGETGINATMIPLTAGQEVYEVLTSLYASGNAPTISMIGQEFSEFQTKFLDLTDTEFAKKAGQGTLDFTTVDGKVYGVPTTVEAYGIIYNPKVVAEVFGADYDPTQIQTTGAFEEFLQKLQDAGVGPFSLSPMDWSLGAHLSNSVYTGQSDNRDTRHKFIEDLKAGTTTLGDNAVFNGWMDTFDLMLKYNIHKDSPLAPAYEDGAMDLATDKAAAWFMGNWAYPMLTETAALDYKFIPVPVSNNAGDYANGKIAIGVPSYWCVDKTNNDDAQQQAAVDFLNWFITTTEGQSHYVNKLNLIPAYSGFSIEPADSMSKQVAEYLNSGKSLEWMNNYYPAGGFQAMGVAMQKYIDGVVDRQGLAKEFENYWKSAQ